MTQHSWRLVALCVILGSITLTGPVRTEPVDRQANNEPITRVDLRALGYNEKKSWEETINRVSVAFTSEQTLALTYHEREGSALNGVFFDPLTGETKFKYTWPEASDLLPTRGGKFLLRNKAQLRLYSSSFESLKQLDVDCSQQRYGNWCYDVWVTPSGRTIFIHQGSLKSFVLRKLDADTFANLRSWTSPRSFLGMAGIGRDSIAEEKIATTGNDFHPRSLYVREVDRPWPSSGDSRFVLEADLNWHEVYRVKRGLVGSPTFLTDDLIALSGARTVVLVKTDGSVLFEDHPVHWPEYLVGGTARSSEGRRVAVTVATEWLNFSDFPDSHRFVGAMVYDVRDPKPIFRVNYRPAWSESIALSPGGTLLAISHGGVLEVFRLPAPSR
jgi:hypothetical protein